MAALKAHGVEFRRGTSGGGNQVRQPYLRRLVGPDEWRKYPRADHVHFYGFYIGNYPGAGARQDSAVVRVAERVGGGECVSGEYRIPVHHSPAAWRASMPGTKNSIWSSSIPVAGRRSTSRWARSWPPSRTPSGPV